MRHCDRCGKTIQNGTLCERCDGYLEGLMEGERRTRPKAFSDGWEAGYNNGYNKGYDWGKQKTTLSIEDNVNCYVQNYGTIPIPFTAESVAPQRKRKGDYNG